ncbi:NAD dependent epimerase/dehydratase, putative [Talaromyces stipitatus ATCC 10500]|uniref:NAD dependent epimerase/dehydratase, putative n=1 Tax=Talaromyces stipitatus (strain ATCC 10500 / CBS 375.48 / QM 6759 / NRRL 1006) TaxID=441959 RepID=B8MIY7_TALSN|nr:NAD dependent epimerase/dehydratase, putative [Talaromyces stipitatus ATCC 10500]EED15649.1 NAD dependent epimerase/dehydratase, putative [Talaromyces stipitatus ATCC 10500]
MTASTFFVTGATGCQGGAVARQLLSHGHMVHAITRSPDSPASQTLKTLGVKLFTGNLDNEAALQSGMQDCVGLFLVIPPADHNTTIKYTTTILSAAKATGTINNVVVSTTMGTDRPDRLAAWNPETAMEQLVRTAGFKYYTILRPGNFMANFIGPKIRVVNPDLAITGVYRTSYTRDTLLPMTDEADTAKFCAAAFVCPERFSGRAIAVASELLTVEEIMEGLSRVSGKSISAYYLSDQEIDEAAAKNKPESWHKNLRDMDKLVDMEEVKAWGIGLNTFMDFLQRQCDIVKDTFSQVAYS